MSEDGRMLLQLHLRGGQTIERVVSDWSVKKSTISNELTELTWKGSAEDDAQMPFIRLDAVDAITVAAVAES